MYTLDYLKSLQVDLEVWDGPGSRFGDEEHFELKKYFSDEQLEPMMENDAPDELMDVIEGLIKEHVENFYVVGCIKCFTVKDADGNLIGECKPYYQGYS